MERAPWFLMFCLIAHAENDKLFCAEQMKLCSQRKTDEKMPKPQFRGFGKGI